MKNDNRLVTKKDLDEKINEIREDMKKWHSDVFNLVDGLAIEVRDGREHRSVTGHQIGEQRQRIEKLEKKVFGAVSC